MSPTILIPVFNDWLSARRVIEQLDATLTERVCILLVDDGSTEHLSAPLPPLTRITDVEVLQLRRNLGHQRAIAIGLSYLQAERDADTVVVMDGDGEDRPADVPRVLERFRQFNSTKVVFAARMRRSEGIVFRVCYHTYRLLHWLLTGIPVRVGNFSVLGRTHLDALAVTPDLWNHYAAAILKTKLPYDMVATTRGDRLTGESKLNFAGMVVHGLSGIAVFMELVGVRLSLAMLVMLAALLALIGIQWWAGWASAATGWLLVLLIQMLTVALGLTFLILFQRNSLSFLPIRDYRFFISQVRSLHG